MAENKLYRMNFPTGGAMVATSPVAFSSATDAIPDGRHRIDEITNRPGFFPPTEKAWGWAVKREDGRVDLEPEGSCCRQRHLIT